MPSAAQQASWDRALAQGGGAPPEDWTPLVNVKDVALRSASQLRGAVWGGEKTYLEMADLPTSASGTKSAK
jgi:hypothetical protein